MSTTTTTKTIKNKEITLKGGLPAYLAIPDVKGKVPAIVLMHERYGMVQHTKDLADRFARDGYVCIAADCFYKHPNPAALHAGDSRYDLTDPESVEYLSIAIDALKDIPEADPTKVAVKGVCQTGRHPLILAAARPITAALVWYGAASKREWEVNKFQPEALDDVIGKVNCPVLGIFGEADHIISVDDVRRFRGSLEKHGKSYTVNIYRDAPHGWLNDTMPGRYRREQAEAGLAAQRAFLKEVFSPDYDPSRKIQRYSADIGPNYDFSKNVRLE
jgi:carboxymethylenebutenolidase